MNHVLTESEGAWRALAPVVILEQLVWGNMPTRGGTWSELPLPETWPLRAWRQLSTARTEFEYTSWFTVSRIFPDEPAQGRTYLLSQALLLRCR